MHGARTRVKMRERAINIKQKYSLRPTPDLGADEDDDQTMDEGNNQPMEDEAANARAKAKRISKNEMKEKEDKLKKDKDTKADESAKTVMIPIPPIFEDLEYMRKPFIPWKAPESFVKFIANSGSEMNTAFDYYDMKCDDVIWLNKYNESFKCKITEDQFESLLDLFEKEAAFKTKMVDPLDEFPVEQAKQKAKDKLGIVNQAVEHIYEYWRARRKLIGKALLRKFQHPPMQAGPHVAFVPRVISRRLSTRNPRKDDSQSYRKMMHLKDDFLGVLEIIEKMKRREIIKRHQWQVQVEEFDIALEASTWGKSFSTEVEALRIQRQAEEAQAVEAKAMRVEKAASAARHPLPSAAPGHVDWPIFKEESLEFPAHFCGPLGLFPEAYLGLPPPPSGTSKQDITGLIISNIPRSNYISFTEEDGKDGKDDKAKKKGRRPPITSPKPRLQKRGKLELMEDVEVASSSSDWDSENESEQEYYQSIERYLRDHGRQVESLEMTKAFDDISLSRGLHMTSNHTGMNKMEAEDDMMVSPKMTAIMKDEEDRSLQDVTKEDQFSGYARGRIGRCGRFFIDVHWKEPDVDDDELFIDHIEEVPEIDLSSIDSAFVLRNGVVVKAEAPPVYIRGRASEIFTA